MRLGHGLSQAGVVAAFLLVGILFRKQYLRHLERLRERMARRGAMERTDVPVQLLRLNAMG